MMAAGLKILGSMI